MRLFLTRASLGLCLLALIACESLDERVENHFERGQELAASGDDARARLEFANALKLDNKHIPSLWAVAQLFERTGDYQAMAGHLARVMELDANHVEARVSMARLLTVSGQLDTAFNTINEAIRVAPEDPEVLTARASILFALGNGDAARQDLDTALAATPFHPGAGFVKATDAYSTGGAPAALATLQPFLDAHPTDYNLNIAKLRLLEKEQDDGGVVDQLEAMIQRFPDATAFRVWLAKWHVETDKTDDAERVFRAYVEASGNTPEAVLELVDFLSVVRGPAAAEDELTRRVENEVDPVPYLFALAEKDHAAGRRTMAKERLQTVVTSDIPLSDRLEAELKLASYEMEAGDRSGAAARISSVLERDTTNVDALLMRAFLSLSDNKRNEALADLNLALKESSDDFRVLGMIAEAHMRNGNPTLAGENFAAAMQASNYGEAPTLRYVGFLNASNRPADAETVLSDAARRDPQNINFLTRLASARLALGDWSGADRVAAQIEEVGATGTLSAEIRAASLSGQRKNAESLKVLESVIEGETPGRVVMASLVRGYVSDDQSDRAMRFLNSLLEDNADNYYALALRSAVHEHLQDRDAAEQDLRTLRERHIDRQDAHLLLSDFYIRSGNRPEWEKVVAEGLETNPAFDGLRMRRAGILERDGAIAEAIEEYEKILDQSGGGLVAINNLVSLVSDHFPNDPVRMARAREIAPVLGATGIPEFRDTYGWLLYLDGDAENALRALLPAAKALPDNPWVRYHIGMTYAALNQNDLAKENLSAAQELAAGTPFPPLKAITRKLADLQNG